MTPDRTRTGHVGEQRDPRACDRLGPGPTAGDTGCARSGTWPALDRSRPIGRRAGSSGLRGHAVSRQADTNVDAAGERVPPVRADVQVTGTPGRIPGGASLPRSAAFLLPSGDVRLDWRKKITGLFPAAHTTIALEAADRPAGLEYNVIPFAHGPEIRGRVRDAACPRLRGKEAA